MHRWIEAGQVVMVNTSDSFNGRVGVVVKEASGMWDWVVEFDRTCSTCLTCGDRPCLGHCFRDRELTWA